MCKDKVVVSYTMGGTHTGNRFGLLPTGRKVEGLTGIDVFSIVDGQIVEQWGIWDVRRFHEQLGLIPSWQEMPERQQQ